MFACPECGLNVDRDLNAANNIKAFEITNAIRTLREEVTNRVEMSIIT